MTTPQTTSTLPMLPTIQSHTVKERLSRLVGDTKDKQNGINPNNLNFNSSIDLPLKPVSTNQVARISKNKNRPTLIQQLNNTTNNGVLQRKAMKPLDFATSTPSEQGYNSDGITSLIQPMNRCNKLGYANTLTNNTNARGTSQIGNSNVQIIGNNHSITQNLSPSHIASLFSQESANYFDHQSLFQKTEVTLQKGLNKGVSFKIKRDDEENDHE